MNFVDRFIKKVSEQTLALLAGITTAELTNEAYDKFQSLLDTDYKINPILLLIHNPEGKTSELKPFLDLIENTTGISFSTQVGYLNEVNRQVIGSKLNDDEKASILFHFYLSGMISFFHLVNPLNLRAGSLVIFDTHPKKSIKLPGYVFEDVFNKEKDFAEKGSSDPIALTKALTIISSEKSPTELMKFLEFIFAIENLERLAEDYKLDAIKEFRTHYQSNNHPSGGYYTYQHITALKLLDELVYVLEDK